jgi:hypothetical protein
MRGCAVRNKATKICTSVSCKPHASFEIAEEPINSSEKLKQTDEYQTLISSLQTKMRSTSSFEENVGIISLPPQSCSVDQTCSEFKVTKYLVLMTRNIIQVHGVV